MVKANPGPEDMHALQRAESQAALTAGQASAVGSEISSMHKLPLILLRPCPSLGALPAALATDSHCCRGLSDLFVLAWKGK